MSLIPFVIQQAVAARTGFRTSTLTKATTSFKAWRLNLHLTVKRSTTQISSRRSLTDLPMAARHLHSVANFSPSHQRLQSTILWAPEKTMSMRSCKVSELIEFVLTLLNSQEFRIDWLRHSPCSSIRHSRLLTYRHDEILPPS